MGGVQIPVLLLRAYRRPALHRSRSYEKLCHRQEQRGAQRLPQRRVVQQLA